jgi:hypothetical protein
MSRITMSFVFASIQWFSLCNIVFEYPAMTKQTVSSEQEVKAIHMSITLITKFDLYVCLQV